MKLTKEQIEEFKEKLRTLVALASTFNDSNSPLEEEIDEGTLLEDIIDDIMEDSASLLLYMDKIFNLDKFNSEQGEINE